MPRMDISLALTLERCLQTALFTVPFMVLLAWWLGMSGMILEFDGFNTVALSMAIVLVAYVIQEGKSNCQVKGRAPIVRY